MPISLLNRISQLKRSRALKEQLERRRALKEQLKNLRRLVVQSQRQPVDDARLSSEAAKYRSEKLKEYPRVRERALQKSAAAALAESIPPLPEAATEEQKEEWVNTLSREAAKLGYREPENIPELLKQGGAPKKVIEAAEQAVSGRKGAPWYVEALNWTMRQLERPHAAYKTYWTYMPQELRKESGTGFLEAQIKRQPGAVVAALRAFAHPEEAPKHIIAPEVMDVIPGLRNLSPRGKEITAEVLDFATGIATDPTMYVGIGPVAKGINVAGKTLKGTKAVEKALQTTRRLRSLEHGIARAERLVSKRAENAQKLAAEIEKTIKEGEKAHKALPNLEKRLARAEEDIAKAGKPLAEKLQQAMQSRQVKPGVPGAAFSSGKFTKVTGLSKKKLKQRLDSISKKVAERNDIARQIEELQSKMRVAENAKLRLDAAKTSLEQAQDLVKRLRSEERALRGASKPGWYLQFGWAGRGIPLANLEPLRKAAGKAWARAVIENPELRRIVNAGVKGFRPLTPLYKEGMTSAEHAELAENIRRLYTQAKEASRMSTEAGGKTVETWAKENIPENIRKAYANFKELPVTAKQQFFAKNADPNIVDQLLKAERIYSESMDEITGRLVEAFGDDFAETLIEHYVPHILKKKPENADKILKAWAEKVAKERVPGAKPSFMYRRAVPTIEDLKQLGFEPYEDIALINATYRAQAEKLLGLKRITDDLAAKGLIKPAKEAKEMVLRDWEDGGKLFPWLKGTMIHPEVARAFNSVKPVLEMDDETFKLLGKAVNEVTTIFKGLVTSLRPAFHFINTTGNMILMRMAGIPYSKQPKLYKEAVETLLAKTSRDKEILDLFKRYGLEGQGQFFDVVQAPKSVAREMEKYLEKATGGAISKIKTVLIGPRGATIAERIPGVYAGRAVGEFVDSLSRMAAFRHFLEQGMPAEEAANLVKRYLFDYSQLTRAERGVRQYLIPFYSWVRFAIPRSILALAEAPGAYTSYFRFQDMLSDLNDVDVSQLPNWLQTALILDTDDEGKIVYINPQPPWETAIAYFGGEEGPVLGAGREFGRSLSPLLSLPFIGVFGRDPTTGKPITEDELADWKQKIADRTVASLKQLTPAWEIEKAFPKMLERPKLVSTKLQGLLGILTSPVSVYDKPLSEAFAMGRLENVIDAYQSKQREEGKVSPGSQPIAEATKRIKAKETAMEVANELPKNTFKRNIIYSIADSVKGFSKLSPEEQNAWIYENILVPHGDLFTGSDKEVREKLNKLFTDENYTNLQQYYGRRPSLYSFLEHRGAIEEGRITEGTTPEMRRLERTVEMYQDLAEAARETGKQPPGQLGIVKVEPPQVVSRGVSLLRERGMDVPIKGTGMTFADVVSQAARIAGIDSSWVPGLYWLAARESNYNPRAVNPTAVNGEHATGLLQMLPSTFKTYQVEGMNNIYDPVHNMVAAIRYIKDRYGHPDNIKNIGNWKAFKGY